MSEPKRVIYGEHSYLEYNCSVYVDPVNGDIYSLASDTVNLLSVYSHDAKGDMAPVRVLKAPFYAGLAVDDERQELFLAERGLVVTYKKTAKDYDSPLRFIQGNRTQLADAHGMALDSKRGLLYVTNWGTTEQLRLPAPSSIPWGDGAAWGLGSTSSREDRGTGARPVPGSGTILPPSITVYPKDAMGDVAPLRVIQGPKTQLDWPASVAVDPGSGELFVANDAGDSVTVYSADANGDVEPIRMIKGPKSLIKTPTGVAYDAKHDELWVSNFGGHAATVYKRTATGDSPPIRVIRSGPVNSPAPMMGNPHVVTYDSKRDQLLVAN
jgi:DNA-binding beta-propeller fold protein YncE